MPRDRPQEPGPTILEDLLDDDDHLDPERLRAACRTGDVELGDVTDEVMLLCGEDADAAPRPFWQPWLRRDDVDANVARATTFRYLTARGMVVTPEPPSGPEDELRFELRQPLSTLAWALASTTGLITYELDEGTGPTETGGVFVLPLGVVLHDHLDPANGLHRLILRDLGVETAWLAALLDPAGCRQSTEAPVVVRPVAELDPHVAALPGRHRTRTVMAATGHVEGVEAELAVTTIGTSAGLWAVQARTGPEPVATLQQLGSDDLLQVAGSLLQLGA